MIKRRETETRSMSRDMSEVSNLVSYHFSLGTLAVVSFFNVDDIDREDNVKNPTTPDIPFLSALMIVPLVSKEAYILIKQSSNASDNQNHNERREQRQRPQTQTGISLNFCRLPFEVRRLFLERCPSRISSALAKLSSVQVTMY